MKRGCVFCQIVSRSKPAKIVHEDDNSVAFLDIAPRSRGMCIVAAKQHYEEFDKNFELSTKIMESALLVAEKVKKALEPKAVGIAIMPAAVPHFHARVYPFYEKEIPLIENKPLELEEGELDEIAKKIKAVKIEIRKPKEKVEEKKEPEEKKKKPKRSEEEIFWIERDMELG